MQAMTKPMNSPNGSHTTRGHAKLTMIMLVILTPKTLDAMKPTMEDEMLQTRDIGN